MKNQSYMYVGIVILSIIIFNMVTNIKLEGLEGSTTPSPSPSSSPVVTTTIKNFNTTSLDDENLDKDQLESVRKIHDMVGNIINKQNK